MKRATTPLALAALALAAVPATAGAASGDRDHDGMRDRWERRHHVHRASGDPDRDRLTNRAEFKVGSDPRDRDSDDDGTRDDQEGAGTIVSFTGGVLTIRLAGSGRELSGTVDARTEIECEDDDDDRTATARTASDGDNSGPGSTSSGSGSNSGPGSGDDDDDDAPTTTPAPPPATDDRGDHDEPGDDRGDEDDDDERCGTEALTAGRVVREAELELASGGAFFEEVELKP